MTSQAKYVGEEKSGSHLQSQLAWQQRPHLFFQVHVLYSLLPMKNLPRISTSWYGILHPRFLHPDSQQPLADFPNLRQWPTLIDRISYLIWEVIIRQQQQVPNGMQRIRAENSKLIATGRMCFSLTIIRFQLYNEVRDNLGVLPSNDSVVQIIREIVVRHSEEIPNPVVRPKLGRQ